MIPKTVYFIWLNEKPLHDWIKDTGRVEIEPYLASWAWKLPDYELKVVTLENNECRNEFYTRCIAEKQYVNANAYLRLWYLHQYGGIYADIDVEVVKPFDDLLGYPGVIVGREDAKSINNAVIVAQAGSPFLKQLIDEIARVGNPNDKPDLLGPRIMTRVIEETNPADVKVLEPRFFYPYHYTQTYNISCITPDTYCVHHWNGSWLR